MICDQLYRERLFRYNPVFATALFFGAEETHCVTDCLPREEFCRTRFAKEYFNPQGLVDGLFSNLEKFRYYYRRHGKQTPISHEPGTMEFQIAYDALHRPPSTSAVIPPSVPSPAKDRTYRWLCVKYFGSMDFSELDPETQRVRRRILESTCDELWEPGTSRTFGDAPLAAMSRMLSVHGQRRSDVVLFGRQHVRDGVVTFTQIKNRNRNPVKLELPILSPLQNIIAASPTGDLTFLVTEFGKPFTAKGFGAKFRAWCDEAGLPHCTAHGLRKAGAVIAAHNGATPHQLMAIFGWRTLKEAERYTKAAEQKRIAASAMPLLVPGRNQNGSG